MMKKFLIISLTLLLGAGWLYAQQNEPITIKFTKSDLETPSIKLSDIADQVSYVKLENHPDALIGDAQRYYISKIPEGFLVYSGLGMGNILLFGNDGKFIGPIGQIGKGPEEYSEYYKLSYDNYSEHVLVSSMNVIHEYNLEGKHLSGVKLPTDQIRYEKMIVNDKDTWIFTYKKPKEESLFEIGVVKTNTKGEILKKWDLTDPSSPGSYGSQTQRNYLYQRNGSIYFCPFDYLMTYKLINNDTWVPFISIEAPFPNIPVDVVKTNDLMKLNDFIVKNGHIMSTLIYGNKIFIRGATPSMFNMIVDIKTGTKQYFGWDQNFKSAGLSNDIDGGVPVYLTGFNEDGIAVQMINAVKLIDYRDNGLLKPDGKSYGPNLSLSEVLQDLKEDDNPVVMVVHVK